MLKVLSFNACLLPPFLKNAGSCNDQKNKRIISFFMKYGNDYDVILFQEIWDTCWSCNCNNIQKYTIELAQEYEFNYHYKSNRKWYQFCNNGLLIVSKVKIDDFDYLTFNNSAGFQWFVPNGVLYVKINNIDFYVTHIHAGPLDSSFRNSLEISIGVQDKQIQELMSFVKVKSNDDVKYIIAGDFNSDAKLKSNDKTTLISYERVRDILQSDSLLKKLNYPNTYPVPLEGSFLINKKFNHIESCIDHVFSNIQDIEIKVNTLKVGNLYLSDHAAIELTIKQ